MDHFRPYLLPKIPFAKLPTTTLELATFGVKDDCSDHSATVTHYVMKRKNILLKISRCSGLEWVATVWPDVGIKSSPIFPKWHKKPHAFLPKMSCFWKNPKYAKYLHYFCTKNCPQDLTKIAQTGHTDPHLTHSINVQKIGDGNAKNSCRKK